MQAAEQALALREAQADPSGVGRNLRWMSTLAWLSGRRAEMERRLSAALEVLEVQPPGPDLAMAYSDLAVLIGLYGGQREEAERAVADAVALAAAVHDPAVLDYVHVRVGLVHAALFADDSPLQRSLDRARQDGHHLEAGMAYQGLAWDAVLRRDWTTARRWIGEGVEYLEPREILGPLRYLRGLQATTELAAGDWTAAEATARWVLAQQGGQGITGVHASASNSSCRALIVDSLLLLRVCLTRRRRRPRSEPRWRWSRRRPTGRFRAARPGAASRGSRQLGSTRAKSAGGRQAGELDVPDVASSATRRLGSVGRCGRSGCG